MTPAPVSEPKLFSWLSTVDLNSASVSEALALVQEALDDLPDDDERVDALFDAEEALLEGQLPFDLLKSLTPLVDGQEPGAGAQGELDEGRGAQGHLDDVERLELEYRAKAAAYTWQEWGSNYYLDLEEHLAEAEDEELLDFVADLRDTIQSVWAAYLSDYSALTTASAEIEVGHRFMKEGYETWMQALDLVEADTDDDEVLRLAEAAVRILTAVSQIDRDVQMQAKSLEPTFQKGC